MYRAITFIELLTTIVVMVIALYFLSPILFRLQQPLLLNNEIDQIKSFIYQVQRQSYYQQKDYQLFISQDLAKKQWCLFAFAEKSPDLPPCNCLNRQSCRLPTEYLFYQPQTFQISLSSSNLYPNRFLTFNSKLGTLDDRCLKLSINNQVRILQINSKGVINEPQDNKRSKCR